jgi:death-on-curing protein
VEDLLGFHARSLRQYGGLEGIRDYEGLESALGAVEQFAYYAPDIDFFDIAAAYAFYIAERHAFVDGNKRTAWTTANTFLEINGFDTHYDPHLAYVWMMALTRHELDRDAFARILRMAYVSTHPDTGEM